MVRYEGKSTGVIIAASIIFLWCMSTSCLLYLFETDLSNPFTYIFILIQTHLYTGLFITAHDAMHGTVSRNKKTNNVIGTLCALLFAFNSFARIRRKHWMHHKYVATTEDPDFHNGGFFSWYLKFLREYITLFQFLLMAVSFNLLKLYFEELNIILYWMLPSVLSTLQLFFFGTFLPHKGQHDETNVHKARSQKRNHVLAFLSCYFFGYHYEHHDSPATPWWLLHKIK